MCTLKRVANPLAPSYWSKQAGEGLLLQLLDRLMAVATELVSVFLHGRGLPTSMYARPSQFVLQYVNDCRTGCDDVVPGCTFLFAGRPCLILLWCVGVFCCRRRGLGQWCVDPTSSVCWPTWQYLPALPTVKEPPAMPSLCSKLQAVYA